MMGGVLDVKSEPGRGSEFFFTVSLPYSEVPAPQHEILNESPSYSFNGKRLLVVEDNEINREIAQTLLEMNDFFVETAGNGQIALQMFCKKRTFLL